MKIAIDVSSVIYGTGVSVYTKSLVKKLLEIDKVNNYLICGYSFRRILELDMFAKSLKGRFETKFKRLPPAFFEILWNKLHLVKFETVFEKIDIYHSSDWTQAPSRAAKVTTIHDLIPILYPEYSLPNITMVHRRRLDIVKKDVDKIIVPSLQTLEDLLSLKFDRKKITVIPEGVDENLKPASDVMKSAVKRKFKINKPFFLSIGITPRKNINRIVSAFKNFNISHEYNLVVVGEAKITIPNVKDIIYTGFVSQNELTALYSSSIALIYPSLYEGFGLPILQSLQCKTPVVTSNLGSMKEIGKKSCILVDPLSVDSIEEGIRKVVKDRTIKNLKSTLDNFSWEKAARMTLGVYESLI